MMVNRHKTKGNKAKSKKSKKENKTYSMPNLDLEPKSKKEEKEAKKRVLKVNRENNENHCYNTWIHNTQKLSKLDLGIISSKPEVYPTSKRDRSYNFGVKRAKDDLQLLEFLLTNLKQKYKRQIIGSSQFENIIKKYMGIDDFSGEPSVDEKKVNVLLASKMLINSITVIQRNMPHQFSDVLRETGKPYFTMIKALNDFGKDNNLKSIPPIHVPDSLL